MTEITHEALEALSADTVFTLENIALAEWLWANLPVGPVKFHDKPTYEKALICHTVSRLAQALRTGQLILAQPSGDEVEGRVIADVVKWLRTGGHLQQRCSIQSACVLSNAATALETGEWRNAQSV